MKNVEKIASFRINHDVLKEGIYVSRVDGDVTTYDLRTRRPNLGDYMDNLTMHSLEHMFATLVRSSKIGERVVYFGPMGCQTGFYLLVRDADNAEVLAIVCEVLRRIVEDEDEMYGVSSVECGNYKNLDLGAAKAESARYLAHLRSREQTFAYEE